MKASDVRLRNDNEDGLYKTVTMHHTHEFVLQVHCYACNMYYCCWCTTERNIPIQVILLLALLLCEMFFYTPYDIWFELTTESIARLRPASHNSQMR